MSRFASVVPALASGSHTARWISTWGSKSGDDVDDPLAIAGFDEMELAAPQPPARGIDVDAKDRADPGLGFEQ